MRRIALPSFLLITALILAACGTVTTSSVPVDGDSDNDGSDTETDCISGTLACQGDEVYQCSDRGAWTFVMDCRLQGDFVCHEGQCVKTELPDGDMIDGDATDGDVDGDATDGDVDADTTDGDVDSDATDGDVDTDATDGDVDADATDGDVDTDATDGDVDTDATDGDVDADATDGDVDADATDGDISDADIDVELDDDIDVDVDTDLDLADGDIDSDLDVDSEQTEWECSGSCDPATDGLFCMDGLDICLCDPDTSSWTPQNCADVCTEAGYTGAESCEYYAYEDRDLCFCYEQECESDQECINAGTGDYCIALGMNTFCTVRCNIAKCDADTACVDIGVGDGCGACVDRQNDPSCETAGASCGTDQICHDMCGLWDPLCSPTCEATPNTCPNDGEICWPLEATGIGIVDGICINFGADCPYCDNTDGDADDDDDGSTCADPCQQSSECGLDEVCSPEGCCIAACTAVGGSCPEGATCNPNTGYCEWCSPACGQDQCCNYSETFWYCGSCCDPPCRNGQACQSGSCVDLVCPDCDPDEICNADTGHICVKYDSPLDGDENRTIDGRACLPPNVDCLDGIDECCSGTCLMGTCL